MKAALNRMVTNSGDRERSSTERKRGSRRSGGYIERALEEGPGGLFRSGLALRPLRLLSTPKKKNTIQAGFDAIHSFGFFSCSFSAFRLLFYRNTPLLVSRRFMAPS